MKVAIDTLNQEPLRVVEDIPAEQWGMDSFDITFVDTIHVVGDFTGLTNAAVATQALKVLPTVAGARSPCRRVVDDPRRGLRGFDERRGFAAGPEGPAYGGLGR